MNEQETKGKQIPKKPIRVKHGRNDSTDGCALCGKEFYEKPNYCPNCGQKIDWSEEE